MKAKSKDCWRTSAASAANISYYISRKWMTTENVGPQLKEVGALVMEDTKNAELLNAFFASVFTAKASPQEFQALAVREKDWIKYDLWSKRIILEVFLAK